MLKSLLLGFFLSQFCNLEGRYVDGEEDKEIIEEYKDVIDKLSQAGLAFNWPSDDILDALGPVAGVAIGPNEDIYVFQRGDRVWTDETFDDKNEYKGDRDRPIREDTILIFSSNVNESGLKNMLGSEQFYMPHGISVDHEENIWVTDVALHQVMKFPKGKTEPSLVLGEKFKPGHGVQSFCKPTHVVVASNGDFFVADGYCNSRILKFNKDGRLLALWGKPENGDDTLDADELNIPHSLTLIEDRDEICVADRENSRVQCYNAGLKNQKRTGNFTASIDVSELGAAYAVAYNSGRQMLGVLGGARDDVTRSDVGFYNVKTKEFVHKFAFPAQEGFGDGHALAFGPKGNRALIGSLTKVCPSVYPEMCDNPIISRNIWLFT